MTPPRPAIDRGRPIPLLLPIVGLAGAGTMTVELAAVRLLAPWFGTSTGVWTNVIGVILLALALGYMVGARLSRGDRPGTSLGLALGAAAVATVWLPLGARPAAQAFLAEGLALDQAAGLLVWGSLATSLVLFLPAAALLGCVGPLAVEVLAAQRGCAAGEAGGRVLAASTLGSLVGTFGTTHLFLPRLGIELTFLGAAGVLALGSAWVLVRARDPGTGGPGMGGPATGGLVLAALVAAGLGLSRYGEPAVGEGRTLLARRQSPYQVVRVVQLPADDQGGGLRYLQVNESFDSFQSVWQPATGLLPAGYYYNHFVPPVHWDGESPGPWRVLLLGLGGGTAVRVLEGALPPGRKLSTVGVEIDPVVLELAARHLDLERGPARAVFAGLDARGALGAVDQAFDQVVLDCYANKMEIPAHLSTVEFFRQVHGVLRDGGWLTVNVGGFGLDDPVVRAVAHTLAVGFEGRVLALRVPFSRNCVLVARRAGSPPEPGGEGWLAASEEIARLLAPLELPGAWRWFEPRDRSAGPLLTDDRNPIDRLQLDSIAAGRRRFLE